VIGYGPARRFRATRHGSTWARARLAWLGWILAAAATLHGCGPAGRIPEGGSGPEDAGAVERGAYLARAANCVGCHTDKKHNGRPFAGGGEVPTPFGVYYSRNISPDRTYGIGAWSDPDFLRALRQGVSPSGEHYFPAFPFPSFTGMSDRDILDIWAWLKTQQPVPIANKPHGVPFPYDVRSTMVLWRLLYFTEGPLVPDPDRSPEWNRGRYLATAVSHCGECHTPRNFLGAPRGGRAFGGAMLAGAGGIRAPNITPDRASGIGAWDLDDIIAVLKRGMEPDGEFVAAPMSDVVEGTSKLTDEDVRAIAVYVRSVPPSTGQGN
jgi:mono/diheme cytochrome c family protein